jgi:hypothetical protein
MAVVADLFPPWGVYTVGLSLLVGSGAADMLLTVDSRGIGGKVFILAARCSAERGDRSVSLFNGLDASGEREKTGERLVWRRSRGEARRLRGGLGYCSSVGACESRRPISTVTDVWMEESRR